MSDDIKQLIDDYYDNLLSTKQREMVEEEIKNSKNYNDLYQKLLSLSQRFKYVLNEITPNKNVLNDIQDSLLDYDELIKLKKEQLKEYHRELKPESSSKVKKSSSNKKFELGATNKINLYFLIPLFLVLVSTTVLIWRNFLDVNSSLLINESRGEVFINGQADDKSELDEGDIIYCGKKSSLRISLLNNFEIEFGNNSSGLLVANRFKNNIIRFDEGEITLFANNLIRNLTIKNNNFSINSFQGIVKLTKHSDTISIAVRKGIVSFQFNQLYEITEGYEIKLFSNGRVTFPQKLNEERKEFKQFLSLEKNHKSDMDMIIKMARIDDALLLFHLIKYGNNSYKTLALEKLNSFYPYLNFATQSEIMSINQDALQRWWDSFSWKL